MGKILSRSEIGELTDRKKNGEKVVLCHGVFDLVHLGHIIHFQKAKEMGDILVVSVTAAAYVRKGPGRPYFTDDMRLGFLSAIGCIDYVILSESYTADDIIVLVEPDLYVKGQEYEKAEDDITGMISEEIRLVREHGGDIAYTAGQVFSSTRLINQALPVLDSEVKEYMQKFHSRYVMPDIRMHVEKMRDLKVLVVGDVIIDEYVYCSVQGLMSKDMGYSARFGHTEQYLGGSLAVARHLSSFTSHVTLMGIVGMERSIHSRMLNDLSDKMWLDLVYSQEYPTVIKKRYVTLNEKREEVSKVFAINNLPDPMVIDKTAMDQFKKNLLEKTGQFDVVVLCDFGHGLVDHEVMDILQKNARFLALNCQTNSSNYGKNLITKYKRADVFALDQKELGLAFSGYQDEESGAFLRLARHLDGKGWLTKGSKGALSVEDGRLGTCPAFTLKVKDTIGAGDAFFALASIAAAAGAPMEVCTFLGNIAGALASNIIGNRAPVEKVNVLKYADTLLNI